MELENLIKKRDNYMGKILKLGITIAIFFIVPAVIAVVLSRYFNISYFYTLGGAFVASWTCVIFLYRKIDKEVRELESQIKELSKK